MSLTECKECSQQISDKAEACPHCGAKVDRSSIGCGGVIILVVFFGMIYGWMSSGSGPSDTPQAHIDHAATTKQDAAVSRAAAGAKLLKKSMRDPDSFKLDSALVINGTGAVCYEYHARNGFGGVNAGQAALSGDSKQFLTSEQAGFSALWNRVCAGQSGQETATAIRWFAL